MLQELKNIDKDLQLLTQRDEVNEAGQIRYAIRCELEMVKLGEELDMETVEEIRERACAVLKGIKHIKRLDKTDLLTQ